MGKQRSIFSFLSSGANAAQKGTGTEAQNTKPSPPPQRDIENERAAAEAASLLRETREGLESCRSELETSRKRMAEMQERMASQDEKMAVLEQDQAKSTRLAEEAKALNARVDGLATQFADISESAAGAGKQLDELAALRDKYTMEFSRLRDEVVKYAERSRLSLADLAHAHKEKAGLLAQYKRFSSDRELFERKLENVSAACDALVAQEIREFAREFRAAIAAQERSAQEALKGLPALVSGLGRRVDGLEHEYEIVIKSQLKLLESRCGLSETLAKRMDEIHRRLPEKERA